MTTATPPRGRATGPPDDDWEAEQEIDFRRYWNGLVARWWLPLLGLVLGAIIGYAISLDGSQVWRSQATIYLGQPYTTSGNVQLQSAQTNPSTVRTLVNSQGMRGKLRKVCKARPKVSVAAVSGNLARLGQTPEVNIIAQAGGPKKSRCSANLLARTVVADPIVAGFANQKIALFQQKIATGQREIAEISKVVAAGQLPASDQLVAQIQLRNTQADVLNAQQLLAQARQVELPKVITPAGATKVTARSRRNAVVVAAIFGLIVGIAAALAWEGLAARAQRRAGT